MHDKNSRPSVPIGLGYALAMNNKALERFAALSDEHRRQVIEESRSIASKNEMRSFVDSLGSDDWEI